MASLRTSPNLVHNGLLRLRLRSRREFVPTLQMQTTSSSTTRHTSSLSHRPSSSPAASHRGSARAGRSGYEPALRWLEDKVHREGVSIGVRGGIDASPGSAKEVYDGREGKAERNAKNGREEEDFGDFESSLPATLTSSLQSTHPHITNPTPTQRRLVRAIVDVPAREGQTDVFVRDRTGRGKTFALVLAIFARAIRDATDSAASAATSTRYSRATAGSQRDRGVSSTRTSGAGAGTRPNGRPGPGYLILLPSPHLVHQVTTWLHTLSSGLPASDKAQVTSLGSVDLSELVDAVSDSNPPRIVVSTPTALLSLFNAHPAIADEWRDSLRLVAIDEVDAQIRQIPTRFSTPRSARVSGVDLHPPAAVRVLSALLDSPDALGIRPRTVWISATLNSPMRAWIWRRGWVRRGEGCAFIDSRGEGDGTAMEMTRWSHGEGKVRHHCLVVDRVSGRLADLGSSSSEGQSGFARGVEEAVVRTAPQEQRGQVHQLMVEAVASLWATSSESDRADGGRRSIVIPPEGTSVPALVSDLATLGVPVSLLDHPTSPPNALLVVSRSQVRGLDLPDLSTVYILGGLGVDTVSKKMRANGGVAEKEREYAHMAGRVGRLGGREEGGGKSQRVVTIVLQGSEEHKAMERFVAGDGGVPLDPWPVPLL